MVSVLVSELLFQIVIQTAIHIQALICPLDDGDSQKAQAFGIGKT